MCAPNRSHPAGGNFFFNLNCPHIIRNLCSLHVHIFFYFQIVYIILKLGVMSLKWTFKPNKWFYVYKIVNQNCIWILTIWYQLSIDCNSILSLHWNWYLEQILIESWIAMDLIAIEFDLIEYDCSCFDCSWTCSDRTFSKRYL